MSDNEHQSWAEKANETAVKMAHEILRTMIIVHGGATLAMLSFIGSVIGNRTLPDNSAQMLAGPLMYFGWGIVLTIGAMIGAYFTDGLVVRHTFQQKIVEASPGDETAVSRLRQMGCAKIVVHGIAVSLTLVSIGAFIFGMYDLKAAMGGIFQQQAAYQIKPVSPINTSIPVKSRVADH